MPATTRMICAAAALLASFAACGVEPAPSTGDQPLLSQQQSALFTNGDFESDAYVNRGEHGVSFLSVAGKSVTNSAADDDGADDDSRRAGAPARL